MLEQNTEDKALKVLDLGCGPLGIREFFRAGLMSYYLGIDRDPEVIKVRYDEALRFEARSDGSYPHEDYMCHVIGDLQSDFLIARAGGLFDAILWCGIGVGWMKWRPIVKELNKCLEIGGLWVFDYHDIPPKSITDRLRDIRTLTHVTGCGMTLDFVPKELMIRNPKVNHRRIELMRKVR